MLHKATSGYSTLSTIFKFDAQENSTAI